MVRVLLTQLALAVFGLASHSRQSRGSLSSPLLSSSLPVSSPTHAISPPADADSLLADIEKLTAALDGLNRKRIKGSEGGLVQGGLQPYVFTKLEARSLAHQVKVAQTPEVRAAFELLKHRAYELLVASGRNPDEYQFDKIQWLMGVLGNVDQDKHFDDATMLMLLLYIFPTVPTKVSRVMVPDMPESLAWIKSTEGTEGLKTVMKLIGGWTVSMMNLWQPLLVGIMSDPPTAPPIKVVNRESAFLLEAGVPHNAPAPPWPGHDPLVPGGKRGSVFATLARLPPSMPVVDGSFMAQNLETLHERQAEAAADDGGVRVTWRTNRRCHHIIKSATARQ